MVQDLSEASSGDNVLRVAWAAHAGASAETGDKAVEFMKQLLPADAFLMTEQKPDVILFMSGGSERKAISMMESGHPVLLISISGNNAYAAATEVMAWTLSRGRLASGSGLIDKWRKTVGVWNSLRGKKAGLIGTVSDWLVASDVSDESLQSRFGITLERIPWSALPDYMEQDPDGSLMERFNGRNASGLDEASRVLTLLRHIVAKNGLSAIAVECFSLVQLRKVTACLALAQLNNEGLVAACEGDLASMSGMILSVAVTGSVPWMANTTAVNNNTLILSHCTVAFDLVQDIKLMTHFETDQSLAVKGTIPATEVTLFRLSGSLDRAFITEGKVAGHPGLTNACRTQVEIALPPQSIALLRGQPLGNHLLMIPGRYADILRMVCNYRGIGVIE